MSESSPSSDGSLLPPPIIYDPVDDPETPPGIEPSGTVVLLLVGEADPRWAARTAVELSAAWARAGRRIVLADLHLEHPVLHETVGTDNLEGVVDVLFYGSSIGRSARPAPGLGFHLIPAGTYTAEGEGVYHHPRWPKLVAGFRDADASLVLFAPARDADLPALAGWISGAVVLGHLRDPASLQPLASAGIPIHAQIVEPSEAEARGREETPLPLLAVPPAPEPGPLPGEDAELHLPPPPVRERPRSRPIYVALLLLAAILVLALTGYVVGRLRPDLVPWPAVLAGAGTEPGLGPADPAQPAPEAPTRLGEPLPYSVQVIAFQSLPAALERLDLDRRRVARAPVFASAEEIGGIVYYKILAGALPDSTAARLLREALVVDGVVEEEDAAGSWALIQNAPLAFALAEYRSEAAAVAAVDSLRARNIPAYPLAVPYSDGTRRWQLYAGAYRDSASAAPMRSLLASAGLTPALVARSGLAPPTDVR